MDVAWVHCRKEHGSRFDDRKKFQLFLKKRKKNLRPKAKKIDKCMKYFKTLVEKGKDVEKILQLKKLKRDENKQNGELSKRLDMLEEKAESELRRIFSRTQACTTTHFNFQLYTQRSHGCILSKIQVHPHPHVFDLDIFEGFFSAVFVNKHHFRVFNSNKPEKNRKSLNMSIR